MSVIETLRYFTSLCQPGVDKDDEDAIESLAPGIPFEPEREDAVRFRFVHMRYKSTRIGDHLFGVEDVREPMKFYDSTNPLPNYEGTFYLQTPSEFYGPFQEVPNETMAPAGWYRVFLLIPAFKNHVTKVCYQIGVVKF